MKKQEEFETTQGMGVGEAWNSDDHHIPTAYTIPLQIDTSTVAASSRSLPSASSGEISQPEDSSSSAEVGSSHDVVEEASWASLQRALSAANTARGQYRHDGEQGASSLSHPHPPHRLGSSLSQHPTQLDPPSYPDWSCNSPPSDPWHMSSPQQQQQQQQDSELDYRLGHQPLDHHLIEHDVVRPRAESPGVIPYAMSPDVWTSTVPTPIVTSYGPTGKMALHECDSFQCRASLHRIEGTRDLMNSLPRSVSSFSLERRPCDPHPSLTSINSRSQKIRLTLPLDESDLDLLRWGLRR